MKLINLFIMRFFILCISLIFTSCVTHREMIRSPFGFQTRWQEGSSQSHVVQDNEIEVVFPAGEFGPAKSGFNWAASLEPREEYTISYEVKFAEDFDFVKGGKLPGLCAGHGSAGVRPIGDDKMSARIMWRKDGRIVSYVYHLDQKTGYGDDLQWASIEKAPLQFVRNQWVQIQFKVKLNSIGQSDGSILGFLNGAPALNKSGLRFRVSKSLKIDRLCFNTFFGGNDPTWAPKSEQRLFLRNLKVE